VTPPRPRVENFVPLLDFAKEHLDQNDAQFLAVRIGIKSIISLPQQATPLVAWQAVLDAALAAKKENLFLAEVEKLVGDGDHPAFEQAMRSCAQSQFQARIHQGRPEFGSANELLAAARSLGELRDAGDACRTLVLGVLSAVEAGSGERMTLLAASNAADLDRLAERIGTLAMNALTILDRMIDLTDGSDQSSGVQVLTPQHPDDFGTFTGAGTNDAQQLTLARNARAAAWTHMQRLLTELGRSTVL
jgi:hypothetical protein